MEISVNELAELLKLAGNNNTSSQKSYPKNIKVSEYHKTWGNVFKEVAPSYGNPDMRHKEFGKMISEIHVITKERMKK
jgi:hypothetical protein